MEKISFGCDTMDNRYYNQVIGEMKPFLDEQGLTLRDDGAFHGNEKAYRVVYDEPRQMYLLQAADLSDGTVGEFSELSAWLFDDSQTEKDAAAVGIDFTQTLREQLGVRKKRAAGAAVDLPTAEKGSAMTISGFTKKVLDVYPQFKDDYKAHVAVYGNFLYLNFFAKTLVPQIGSILHENNKKTVKKMVELLNGAYRQGDRETANTVVAVLTAATFEDETAKTVLVEALADCPLLKAAFEAFLSQFAKNKKLRAAFSK